MITDDLAGKRVAVTGATGFLGTALVERLLRCVPGCEIVVLVRPGQRLSAADRTRREILRNDCFDRLRSELGDGFEAEVDGRLTTIAGDVGRDGLGLDDGGRRTLASCDIVIHSAATVSFDAPLDGAVEVNLLGPSRVAETLQAVCEEHGSPLPHLIAVSTAYVNSGHKGDAFEELITSSRWLTETSWRSEVRAARRTREDADAESRRPERLAGFHKAARAELGAAGTSLLAEKTESLRQDWVQDRMVAAGRARAQALGWPDAYAYTKSLGERALLETRGDLPVTFVRPSIVESALAEPRPGWIRGFRMAEPVIISYARGLLRQFPGVPEGVVDVVPVDLVVAAIIAVAAHGPDPQGPTVFQVASGTRNPLLYGTLVHLTELWFTDRPLYDHRGQPIVVPKWSFPGRGKVQGELRRASAVLKTAERAVNMLPVRGERAEFAGRIEDRRSQAERALEYVELYGAYAETEARFRIDRTLELFAGLSAEEQKAFCFDPGVIDWRHYVQDVHLPSVVEHARVRTSPGRRVLATRESRSRTAILSSEPRIAVFDLENTLIASNVVESYAWLATRHLDRAERVRIIGGLLVEAPRLLALDRRDRSDFLRSFYRRYEGAPVDRLRLDGIELWSDLLALRAFPDGLARLRQHRTLGHRTVLITGALDFVVEPLRPLFDEIVCGRLGERDGKFTGEMVASPPTGEARALLMEELARTAGLQRDQIVAYADSTSDLPMLEAAGLPVAVNPEPKLAAIARRRGWSIEHWTRTPGGPRRILATATMHPGLRSAAGRSA
ncbi:MAG TPA: HAD-IB family phosphatase [Acidimicrobiales bacterium]|nr:HAD-IB family phosphatase [Acidimicrobiales bacterium]